MKLLLLGLIFIVFFSITQKTYAVENEYEIGYNILPKKIHQNDTVLLEIYNTSKGQITMEKIQNLEIESVDKEIIEIIDLEETHYYKTLVKFKAKNEGETILYVLAKDSESLEIPITVYGNNFPKNISLDIFPDNLDAKENNQGIFSLFFTDENGKIVNADKDYLIKLSTSKSGIVSLSDSNMIISKGESSIKQKFSVMKPGIVTITAKTDDLESFEILTVEENPERTIEIAIIPETISSSRTSNGHLIAQLFSDGKLTKATEDITVYYEISSDSTKVNTSSEITTPNPKGYFQIEKGQTGGHHSFSIQKGITDTYTVIVTSQDPLIIVEETFDTVDTEFYGEDEIKFSPLPVLADGNRQLVGIIYLEDENGHPVTANQDIIVPFTASDGAVFIETAMIKNGFDSSLVYGNMGNFVPLDKNIALKIKNPEIVEMDIHGFDKDSISLNTHTFSNTILKGEQRWIIVYMESSDGKLFEIPEGQQIEFSKSEIFKIDQDRIETFPYFILIPVTAIDSGIEDITLNSGEFETDILLSSISSKPDSLDLDYSKELFKGIKDSVIIQILDSQGLPIQINEEIKVKIFSSDHSIIDFPKEITIPSKSSFVKLDTTPIAPGTVEISLVSEGLSIVTKELIVKDASPTIQITSSDIISEGESFIVSILAKHNGVPLQNAQVKWELEGGIATLFDEKTGPTGEAMASIIATSDDSVKIIADINNGSIQSAFASKIIKVNATIREIIKEDESQKLFEKPDFGGFDPVLIAVPILIGGMLLYMKKKSKK